MKRASHQKMALVDELMQTNRKGIRLALTLRFQNRLDEEAEVRARNGKLVRQIDRLLAAAMEDWLGSAAALQAELKKTNAKLQDAIREIQREAEATRNITKALGYLDEAIQIGIKLLG